MTLLMTRLLYIKLLRDVRATWARLVLMVVAMSVTLVVFSGVLYVRGITGREIPRAYLSTSPASATILFKRALDASTMAAIAAEARMQPGIIDAAPRTQLTLQIQKGGRWGPNPIQIFVAEPSDPMRLERFSVEQGSWPPAVGEILIDRSSLGLLNLEVGDTVVVRAPSGTPVPLRASGVVYVPALAPSFQEQKGHGFMSTVSLPALGEPAQLNALKIQVADEPGLTSPSRDRDVIVAASRELARRLSETHGVAIDEIQVPTPYAHPHQRQADLLLMALIVFGAAGLLLSAILVATMLHGLFAQQVPQIGMMKAIGARSSQIFQLYVLMTLAISITATALAIVPGVLISRAFAPAMLTLLGVKATSLAAPWWMNLVVVACGIGAPLLLSLASLVKASRATVRDALDYQGIGRAAVISTRFGAWLSRLHGLDRTLLLAFRNIFRRRARLFLSVGLLASAGAVFVAGISTMAGVQAMKAQSSALRQWDVDVQLADANQTPTPSMISLVDQLPHVMRVEAWTIVHTSIAAPGQVSVTRTYPDQGHGSLSINVIPPNSSLISPPPLLEGRWLHPGETGAIVLSQAIRGEALPSVRSGDAVQLTIGGRATSWIVVGIAKSVFHGVGVFMTEEALEAATGAPQPNVLRIVTDRHDEHTRTAVAIAAERVLTDASIRLRSSASVSRLEAAGAGHMLPLIAIFLGLSIAIGVVGCIGLASTMSTNVLERTREFGVMRAIGASAATVRRIVVAEGIFVAVASCVVAALPALLLTVVMSAGLGNLFLFGALPFRVSGLAIVIWVVVAVLGATLASLVPAYRASRRLTVREALRCL